MSLRAADIRFLLARPPASVYVAPALQDVAQAFAQAGVPTRRRAPDLAIVQGADLPEAVASDPEAVIAFGRSARRPLAGQMPVVRRFITLPSSRTPHLIVPVDRPLVARYALETWTFSDSRRQRLRNRLARAAIALGAFPDLKRSLTVGSRHEGPPFVLAAARPLGIPAEADWFLTLGLGDDLTRAVYHLFSPGERGPRWVVKFSRVPGHRAPFERDEHGLALVAASPTAAAHAPRFLGRFEVAGLSGSAEEAVIGRRLTYHLQEPGDRAGKLRAIESVAAWLVALSQATSVPAAELVGERERLEREVLPPWGAAVASDLVRHVEAVPGVLQHNDLGSWNLIVGPAGFHAVDWESAVRAGLPLWDLIYFLVDALVHLDRAWAPEHREAHAARLLCGETDSSRVLFDWLARGVKALSILGAAVGPVVTLGWLHHGLSSVSRAALSHTIAPTSAAPVNETFAEWISRVWLTTPGLGPEWSAFSRSAVRT